MAIFEQLRDELPALQLRGHPLRRSLRTITLAWMFGIVWMTVVSGAALQMYARALGFGEFAFGVLGALPFLASFGQVIGSAIVERTGRTKRQFLLFALLHRLMWVVVAAIPLVVPVPSAWAVGVMLTAVFANWVFAALAVPAWMTWMGDLIPRRIRGRYTGNRARLSLFLSIPAAIASGVVLDRLDPARPETVMFLSAFLLAAGLFGAVDILLFVRVREVRPTPRDDRRPGGWSVLDVARDTLVAPMRDPIFRGYGLFVAALALSTGCGWFFVSLLLETIRISKLGVSVLFFVVGPVAGMLTARAWGRGVDRFGRRPILVTATAIATIALAPYFLASVHTPNPAWLTEAIGAVVETVAALLGTSPPAWSPADAPVGAYLLLAVMAAGGGIGWMGIGVAQTGVMFGFADGPGRSRYVAAAAVLSGIGGAVSGLLGGAIASALDHLADDPLVVGPFVWNHLHAVSLLVVVTRSLAVVLAWRMPDPGAGAVRTVARAMGMGVYNAVVLGLFRPWRWVGPRRRRTGPIRRPRR